MASSTRPSQSLSRPLHTSSAPGKTLGLYTLQSIESGHPSSSVSSPWTHLKSRTKASLSAVSAHAPVAKAGKKGAKHAAVPEQQARASAAQSLSEITLPLDYATTNLDALRASVATALLRWLYQWSGVSLAPHLSYAAAVHVRRGDKIAERSPADKIRRWSETDLTDKIVSLVLPGVGTSVVPSPPRVVLASDDNAFARAVSRRLENGWGEGIVQWRARVYTVPGCSGSY